MSTTTQDVLLSDPEFGIGDAPVHYNNNEAYAWVSGAYHAKDVLKAERTKLLDLIRQGVEAVKKAGHAEECDATSELHEQLPCGEGWVNLGAAGPCNCGHEAYLAKVKEQLPNL